MVLALLHGWHLLSLDGPSVAVLWTMFLSRVSGRALPRSFALAMFLAVWVLYAGDRLLDSLPLLRRSAPGSGELEMRHHFHHQHRFLFASGMALASVALAFLLPRLPREALSPYLVLAVFLTAWLLRVHLRRQALRVSKEIVVGLFFAAAATIPSVALQPAPRYAVWPAAVLFAATCSLNCLSIARWEHSEARGRTPVRTTFVLRHLPIVAAVLAALCAVTVALAPAPSRAPAACCAVSSALLLSLDRLRPRMAPLTLRALADLALLTPLPLMLHGLR